MNEFLKKNFVDVKNIGKIKNADRILEYKSSNCSDSLRIYIDIDDEKIINIKYQVFGCWGVVAGAAITSNIVKGLTIGEVLNISNDFILDTCGEYDKEKEECLLSMLYLLKKELKK